ncbi:MAG: DUF3256 family protein [Muribaculaceae bacterium]|nr:DUF3256 family protein [Muribaculaceae bacterium]
MRSISLFAVVPAVVIALLTPAGSAAPRPEAAPSAAPRTDSKASGADTISARRAFVGLPATTLDLLPRDTRLDMLDYFDVDSIYRAPNTMDGRSWLDTVTPDYLKVVMTPVSTLEIKVLPDRKHGDIVMTVYTIGAGSQAADSEVQFYDAALRPLDASKLFKPAQLSDFVELSKDRDKGKDKAAAAAESPLTMREVETLVPFPTVEYSASPDNTDLIGCLTVGKYMDLESYRRLEPYLTGPVTYRWDGSRFRADKRR